MERKELELPAVNEQNSHNDTALQADALSFTSSNPASAEGSSMEPPKMNKKLSFEYSFTGSATAKWEYGKEDIDTTKSHNINCCNQAFFNFMDSTIDIARNKEVDLSDLPNAHYFEKQNAEEFWKRYKEKCESIERDENGNRNTGSAVSGAIWQMYGCRLYLGIFLAVLEKLVMLIRPLLMGALIEYLYDKDAPQSDGWFYANFFALAMVASAVISRQSKYCMDVVSLQGMRTMTKISFQKILRLAVETDIEGGVGKIVNICSSDISTITRLYEQLAQGVVAPLEFILITYLLHRELGHTAFMIWAVLVLVMLIIGGVGAWIATLYTESLRASDARIKTITEILNGIKLFKLYGWEDFMQKRVEKVRKEQISVSKDIFSAYVIIIGMISLTQVMLTLIVFGMYMALGNDLDVRKTMVCMSYFAFFGFALMNTGFFLQAFIPYFTSRTRLAGFWDGDELARYIVKKDNNSSDVLFELREATLSWRDPVRVEREEKEKESEEKVDSEGTDEVKLDISNPQDADDSGIGKKQNGDETLIKSNFKLKALTIQIRRGELTAIVGSVASGKSSIMAALVGEMYKLDGEVISHVRDGETVCYLPQKHYILNATVRENVCMDLPFNSNRYVSALRNAAFVEDINRFDDADKTEIGAKGINISGGQKARVTIARALYQEADVYLLDDVLSAVDPDVGDEIFNRAILGAMMDTTRVIVMNSHLHNLQRCDHIVIVDNGEVVAQGKYDQLIDEYAGLMAPKTGNEDRMKLEKEENNQEDSNQISVEREDCFDGEGASGARKRWG